MHTNLLIDMNNYSWITRFSKIPTPPSIRKKEKFVPEMIFYYMLAGVVQAALEHKADSIVAVLDSPHTWRKSLYPEYKQKDGDEDIYKQEVIDGATMFANFLRQHSSATVLQAPRSEADDIIAVWCKNSNVKNIIFSSDRDFVQLVNETTSVYSPPQKTFRISEDVAYELFMKCIRGDSNDNIKSAYPRVRETVLKAAWEDQYKMVNLMETVLPSGHKVGDLYENNSKLIDFKHIPDDIQNIILESIKLRETGTFNQLKAIQFFIDNHLKEQKSIFSGNVKCLKTPPLFLV